MTTNIAKFTKGQKVYVWACCSQSEGMYVDAYGNYLKTIELTISCAKYNRKEKVFEYYTPYWLAPWREGELSDTPIPNPEREWRKV